MAGGANFVLDKGYIAGGAIGLYRLVKLSANDTVVVTAASTDQSIGIVQETISAADATSGRISDIRLMGISKAIAGAGGVTRGALLRADASGGVIALAGTAGVNEVVVGIALETGNAADWVDILLTPGARSNTAVS